ncbi:MAG: Rne/Rng family ribonuclease [Thermoanaerobacteraceae bacterium]|nr:Rne/Rng family ribonuclease [Thermoanaerobacteraceae bacterium]
MYKEIIVHVDDQETTVALLEDQRVAEVYLERSLSQRLVGNIYKGKVENVLPGMQAAFVDIGLEKNAFLYVEDAIRQDQQKQLGSDKLTISDVVKQGQEIIVQIVKEPIGTKGARVTRNITLPGRNVVLMPTVSYVGISRRIANEGERERLRQLAEEIKPDDMGVIVRTVADGISAEEMAEDIETLVTLWKQIQIKAARTPAPNIIHKDLELIQRILRDLFTEDVDRFLVNSPLTYEKVMEALSFIAPELKNKVSLVREENLLEKYNVRQELTRALERKVWLKCGGYIIIDQMEALTAIDVNTGKYVGSCNLEDTVLKTNLEAAVEIARQIRLRNIGGIIVIDFIDMSQQEHWDQVLQALEEELKHDKMRTNVLGLTQLCLVELTRKKVRQSLKSIMQKDCPYCNGDGKVLSEDTVSLRAYRDILDMAERTQAPAISVTAHPLVAAHLIGSGGSALRALEEETGKQILITGREEMHIEDVEIRTVYDHAEIERLALPVKEGEVYTVKVEEPHMGNPFDGVGRVNGFVIDVEGGGPLVGQEVDVKINRVFRTYARAEVINGKR